MSAQHTPGPWVADTHRTRKRSGRTYATIHSTAGEVVPLAAVTLGVEGMPEDEGRANAVLIAASPDLLNYLQLAVGIIEQQRGILWPGLGAAKSAIVKATGATS